MDKFRNHPIYRKICGIIGDLGRMEISVCAANAGFFLILAAFPVLLLLLSLLRYTDLDVTNLIDLADGVIPDALMPYVERLVRSTYENASGAMVGVSALVAVWSASKGMHGLMHGLNSIYRIRETRNYLFTRLLCMGYTFLFLIVLLLTLVLHVFGQTILNLIPPTTNPFLLFITEMIDLRFFLLLFLQTVVFTVMFMIFPNGRMHLRESLPGALLASIGWLLFSDLFSIYMEHFPKYANIYGSIYAVALSMLWLYFCLCIVFFGGALNYFLMRANREDVSDS